MENKTVIIKNEFLEVEIAAKGAEIQSVKTPDGFEFMWDANPDVWARHAPVLFPNCGRFVNDEYTYNGKKYHMTGHGFALNKVFDVKSADVASVVFSIGTDDETKVSYPFDFEFEVKYSLEGKSLKVDYTTKNLSSDEPLYFSCGSHEAFACPEGVADYKLVFEKEVNLDHHPVDPASPYLVPKTVSYGAGVKELQLNDEYFTIDGIILRNLGVNKVALVHKNSSKKITVEFPEMDTLLFWTKYKGPYLCIEPWAGFPEVETNDGSLENKLGINRLEASAEKTYTHIITFEK